MEDITDVGTQVERLHLRPPTLADGIHVEQGDEELAREGFGFLDVQGGTWAERLSRLEQARLVGDPERGYVPFTSLVAEVDGELVGSVSIRHELNASLRVEGGHIGYAVRPAFRRRGYATRMLELALDYLADQLGVEQALVTCNDDNIASRRVIERCGGQFEDITNPSSSGDRQTRRYWFDLRDR